MRWKVDSCADNCHHLLCVESDQIQQERPTKREELILHPHPLISSCLFVLTQTLPEFEHLSNQITSDL